MWIVKSTLVLASDLIQCGKAILAEPDAWNQRTVWKMVTFREAYMAHCAMEKEADKMRGPMQRIIDATNRVAPNQEARGLRETTRVWIDRVATTTSNILDTLNALEPQAIHESEDRPQHEPDNTPQHRLQPQSFASRATNISVRQAGVLPIPVCVVPPTESHSNRLVAVKPNNVIHPSTPVKTSDPAIPPLGNHARFFWLPGQEKGYRDTPVLASIATKNQHVKFQNVAVKLNRPTFGDGSKTKPFVYIGATAIDPVSLIPLHHRGSN
ncbi:Aste57867_6101 [Aphanomyces stellatus]|uniref:Aste57867_6101 protein n=1 Tax=Aphanomyces stellatus TaxID=120398 RepID=A0A485KED5_9STRA|nr:hypothetical protein As57867_006087 [Aphanomyces stellatus]VFT83108.1 Aste57867_6101 [Aphanomyces stellatus]